MVFKVDGTNLLPYLEHKGIKWSRNDLDDPDAGRTLDGVMHRGRVSTKIRLDIKCKPLTSEAAAIVLQAVQPEYVTVQYTDPKDGLVTKQMYSNNIPTTHMQIDAHNVDWWEGIEFPLIEV